MIILRNKMDLKYCANCGNEVDWNENFCRTCGEQLSRDSNGRQSKPEMNRPNRKQQAQPQRREPEKQNNTNRRGFLVSGIGIVTVAGVGGAGYLFWQQMQEGPKAVAEDFIQALDNGNFQEANDLIHSDATFDGAGAATDLISAWAGTDIAFEIADISVTDSETVEQANTEAIVSLKLNIDIQVDQARGQLRVGMKKDSGDWRVWNILG